MPERLLLACDAGQLVLAAAVPAGPQVVASGEIAMPATEAFLETAETVVRAAPAGAIVDVWLGSAWMPLLTLDWPSARLDTEEQQALLRVRWSAVLSDLPAWRLLLAGQAGGRRLSAAVPEALVSGLRGRLLAAGLRSGHMIPAVCGVLAAKATPPAAALAFDEGDRATLLRTDANGVVVDAMSRRRINGEAVAHWLSELGWRVPVETLGGGRAEGQPACMAWLATWR